MTEQVGDPFLTRADPLPAGPEVPADHLGERHRPTT